MNRIISTLVLTTLSIVLACGGGGGGNKNSGPDVTGGGSSNVVAGFIADVPSPGAQTVSMGLDSAAGDVVSVKVRVTDVDAIYGAAFDVVYDPVFATYEGWTAGTLLEGGGHTPNYAVNTPQAGRVVVGVSRTGNVNGVNAVGTRGLISLTFRVRTTGTAAIRFQAGSLADDKIPPGDIAGLSWAGGTLTGS